MAHTTTAASATTRPLFGGFIAGFLATLIFHQLTLVLLWSAGVAPFGPFSMASTPPFGVPAVLSLAFWGGVWDILFALVDGRFPRGVGYWVTALLFGAILPSLVSLLVVFAAHRPAYRWSLVPASTADGVSGQWRLGYRNRIDFENAVELVWLVARLD
jgi:hypothetical protein